MKRTLIAVAAVMALSACTRWTLQTAGLSFIIHEDDGVD